MMPVYTIFTWTAIATLAFGSTAVFVIFLVTTLRDLRRSRNLEGTSCLQKTPGDP
jgi:hypothetical protein